MKAVTIAIPLSSIEELEGGLKVQITRATALAKTVGLLPGESAFTWLRGNKYTVTCTGRKNNRSIWSFDILPSTKL